MTQTLTPELADLPIEGTWSSGDDRLAFDLGNPAGWSWTLAVPVPSGVRLVQRPAQRVAWIVHHGPYEDEGPTLAALYRFVAAQGVAPAGPHTEVYRYYRAEQVRTTTTIALLRSLDVPLAVVRDVLAAPDADALRSIERLARSPAAVSYDVTIAPQSARRLVGLTGPVTIDGIGQETAALCRRVARLLGDGEISTVCPLDLEDTFALTAGIIGAAPVDGAEEHELPGGDWASTLHVGPYEELPMAYVALLEHLRERGHEPRAPMVETYLTDPTAAEPNELVTRVAVAMAPAGEGGRA